jgi:hypothetical protein
VQLIQPASEDMSQAETAIVRHVVRCLPPHDAHYRYLLEIALRATPSPRLVVVMKNPSTASQTRSDPTIGKVKAWACRHGFGAVAVVNLFALRATQPSVLNRYSYADSVGPENDRIVQAVCMEADRVVVAWGEASGMAIDRYERRIREVLALLAGVELHAVGPLTRRGYPRHGLLWNGGCELALCSMPAS